MGVASIAAGIYGLVFLDYKFNKPDDVKVFAATCLLGYVFWSSILSIIGFHSIIMFINYSAVALSLCTGFGAAKLTEIYGARGHTIPRFLLGFLLGYLVVYWLLGGPQFRGIIYIITGLLFTPISLLTPNFILAFIIVFGFSALITNGLFLLSMIALPHDRYLIQVSCAIGTILLVIRLFYYIKEESNQSDAVDDAERQPIVSDENPSYNAVNDDEETLIGTN
ncbi:hypothetical protein CONCODRAFT_78898 [Conidiobolus coronatus NRRL 28638]|uniref:Uncharacterized protein n=1 Tax=Conidiobolus coronatus (strain ATCC 28846 / CBS 209.66 / NRRL 28638) TaxID=796925 RepID=A0A137P5V6_CONC2|nr:hypothetical protein CONCODRAFT_78898 [Conidiobolus coronatus NRRL 28638]|eukprot:KXN70349.1 hypothetical protein CONCODRAFT_78898 [Conidiobolus coronatus NRRL 28638]